MDPLSIFALSVATIIAAENASVAQRYAAAAQYGYPVVAQPAWEPVPHANFPVAPNAVAVPGWIAGADVGSHIGATVAASRPTFRCHGRACTAGFNPSPVIAGALIGGLIGHAASAPPVLPAYPVEVARAPRSNPSSSKEFVEHWQNFMEQSVSRP